MVEWPHLFDKMMGPMRGSRFPNDLQSGVREAVRTIPKDCLLHPLGSYQKDGNSALTSVGSMWGMIMRLSSSLSLYSRRVMIISE
jgi:hypothetical protein